MGVVCGVLLALRRSVSPLRARPRGRGLSGRGERGESPPEGGGLLPAEERAAGSATRCGVAPCLRPAGPRGFA